MVIVRADETQLRAQFLWLQQLCQGTARNGRRVQILAAADPDGVVSAKILVFLLNQLMIDYSLRPVKDNEDIHKYIAQVAQSCEPPPVIICLNCGANFRWDDLEEKGVSEDVKCLVIDSHRPVKLSNASERAQRVIIIDDDPEDRSCDIPSDSESDSESQNDELQSPGGEIECSQPSRKRQRNAHSSRTAKKSRIKKYYDGTFFANPAAVTVYRACDLLEYRSADMLWCACVSLTAHLDLGMMSRTLFQRVANDLEDYIYRLSLDIGVNSRRPNLAGDALQHYPIRFEKEINAPLFRHWSLWEALFHSNYVYGSLQLYRDRGVNNLKEFLALCGIVPQEYNNHFMRMNWSVRKNLIESFQQYMHEFQLDNITSMQFNRQYPDVPKNAPQNTPTTLSYLGASECALMLESLLDNDVESTTLEAIRVSGKNPDALQVREWLHKGIVNNFYRAYDASMFRNYTLLSESLHNAIKIQELLEQQALQIISERTNADFGGFRCVVLEHVLDPILRRPLMVRRLALWFVDVMYRYKDKRAQVEVLPQVVAVKDPLRRLFVCVGVIGNGEDNEKNEFSERFRHVIRMSGCRCTPQSRMFDESMIEVFDADFLNFLKALKAR
eukprot:GEMP01008768.1.p1 GENE.GEMP01008768.1~~GEMP01008768.1.p1  ORF type:complete len:613 (+),score=103.44 GEMP01008768.1:85-1923(+)